MGLTSDKPKGNFDLGDPVSHLMWSSIRRCWQTQVIQYHTLLAIKSFNSFGWFRITPQVIQYHTLGDFYGGVSLRKAIVFFREKNSEFNFSTSRFQTIICFISCVVEIVNYKIFGNLDKPNSNDIRNEKQLFSPLEHACFFYEINSPYFKFTSPIAEYGVSLLECLLNKKIFT